MKLVSCLVSLLFFSASSFQAGGHLKSAWEAWKLKHEKSYASDVEEVHRFEVWKENYAKIKAHNAEEGHTYKLAMNKFGDLTEDDFSRVINPSGNCMRTHEVNDPSMFKKPVNLYLKEIPTSVNWANSSAYVTPVKNQGSCGSCWAFAAAGATESAYAIANGVLNTLSEQELVDCSTTDYGCDGGWIDTAFQYILDHHGLALGSEYTYTAVDGTCKSSDYTHYDPIHGYHLVERYNETALEIASVYRPVGVAVQANQLAFQFYSSGIMNGRCGTAINHAVIVVGYGVEGNDKYWIIKNSWGTSWGENGYARICKNCDKNGIYGECCINCDPSYPIVEAAAKVNNPVNSN